jgi:D-alanine-D-alanine ligase
MNKKLNIGFTFDAKSEYEKVFGDDQDKIAEFDTEETLNDIENALKSGGHRIERIGNIFNLLKKITAGKRWDIVFNIAEGISGRNRESQVPVVLEMFDIPYVGSDGLTMGLTLDKSIAKKIVRSANLKTPDFFVLENGNRSLKKINYPVIVKPLAEGTSKGLTPDSVVHNPQQLREQAKKKYSPIPPTSPGGKIHNRTGIYRRRAGPGG